MKRQHKQLTDHRSRRLRFEACEERLPLDGDGFETVPLFASSLSPPQTIADPATFQSVPQWLTIDANNGALTLDNPPNFSDQLNVVSFLNSNSGDLGQSSGVSGLIRSGAATTFSGTVGVVTSGIALNPTFQFDGANFSRFTLGTSATAFDDPLPDSFVEGDLTPRRTDWFADLFDNAGPNGVAVLGTLPLTDSGGGVVRYSQSSGQDADALDPFVRPVAVPRLQADLTAGVETPAGKQTEIAEASVGETIAIAALFVDNPNLGGGVGTPPAGRIDNAVRLASAAALPAGPSPATASPGLDSADRVESAAYRVARAWAFEFATLESGVANLPTIDQAVESTPSRQTGDRPTAQDESVSHAEGPVAASFDQGEPASRVAAVALPLPLHPATIPSAAAAVLDEGFAFEPAPTLTDTECQRCGLAASTLAMLAIERVRRRGDETGSVLGRGERSMRLV